MDLKTRAGRHRLLQQVFQLLESINALEPDRPDHKPSTPLVGAMLETMTNERLIALLRGVLENQDAFRVSLNLSRRSDLFDKLIILKGKDRDWVLRLHTYNMSSVERKVPEKKAMAMGIVKSGVRGSNLGGQLADDEENTHLHRWRLSSRFVTGGFNNVTWDENDRENSGELLNKYQIPATAKTIGSGDERVAQKVGLSDIAVRRTELYQAGDIVTYPILDPHSVNSGLAALTGTTMTLAHTGQGIIEDSYFFAKKVVPTVAQLKFDERTLTQAIILAITRLQLVELNNELAATDRAFRHLNAFETELLPRLAEYLVLARDVAPHLVKSREERARAVGLSAAQVERIDDMDSGALAHLIVESQQALWNQDFAKNTHDLLVRFPPPPLAERALRSRDFGVVPQNVIGPTRK